MPSRVSDLTASLAALRDTHVSLLAYYPGNRLGPAGPSDDPGLYWAVPRLALWLNLSVTQAATMLLTGVALLALAVGLVGTWKASRTRAGMLYGFAALIAVSLISIRIGDVYVFLSAMAVAAGPWLVWLSREHSIDMTALVVLPIIGFASGISNAFRSQSGTAVIVFAALLMLLARASWRRRAGAVALLVAAALLATLAFGAIARSRDSYLASRSDAYILNRVGHPLWHSVYIGFGYVQNPWVPQYLDEVAIAKVREVDPSAPYLSQRYEQILRAQVFSLVRAHPLFVMEQTAAKSGVFLFYLLVFGNVGLVAAIRSPKGWRLDLAFVAALASESLFGFLVVPKGEYLLGFFAFAAVFAAASVDEHLSRKPATRSV